MVASYLPGVATVPYRTVADTSRNRFLYRYGTTYTVASYRLAIDTCGQWLPYSGRPRYRIIGTVKYIKQAPPSLNRNEYHPLFYFLSKVAFLLCKSVSISLLMPSRFKARTQEGLVVYGSY